MNFQDLGATGIIGIILFAFALIGFFKGLIRTMLALACLGISGYVAFLGHQHADTLVGSWVNNPQAWLPWTIAIIAGLTAFILCRYLLNFLVNPFNASSTIQRIGFGLPAALITFCLGAVFIWLLFSGIRYGGSLAEIEDTQFKLLKDEDSSSDQDSIHRYTSPLLLKAKRILDTSSAGKWQQHTDPFHSPEKVTLCKTLILYHHTPSRQRMLKTPMLKPLLNQASFLDLAYRDEIKKAATSGNARTLFSNNAMTQALADPELLERLYDISPNHLEQFTSG